ncbi:N-acetylmuramoyl-L-alanine amidase [Pararhodobacter sp.]|uniref:N-acetylmuramoyl-L-alanine amidase n=1 Tax=Pararhodobacter sp. TaxID=2127056 RepID=UPI002FDD3131
MTRPDAAGALWHPSPNTGPRRDGLRPELVVLHYTQMQGALPALTRLCAPEAQVSAHYLIGADGQVWQMVSEAMRAWHAGAGSWRGQEDINSRSIGIELDNDGDSPFAAAQMLTLEQLLSGVLARWSIPPAGVIAHSDMAPERKSDPGPRFDWHRLARLGLSVWPGPDGDRDAPLAPSLTQIGYPAVAPDLRLAAFRLRFRPGHKGPEDSTDRARAAALAALLQK